MRREIVYIWCLVLVWDLLVMVYVSNVYIIYVGFKESW